MMKTVARRLRAPLAKTKENDEEKKIHCSICDYNLSYFWVLYSGSHSI